MSALRTLRRRHKDAGMVRNDDGELVAYKRIKPGAHNRRILAEVTVADVCHRYHATKGMRKTRTA